MGNAHGGGNLAAGNLHADNQDAEVHHGDGEEQEQQIPDDGVVTLDALGSKAVNRVHADVLVQFDTIADADVDHPDKEITRQLLRPGKGAVQNIPAKDLSNNHGAHQRQGNDAKHLFDVLVQKTKGLHSLC